ncbi:hypothetical protein OH686_07920 [Pseudomonas sp. SO81]|nr:hypothetical protein OH686_07920 [Pseudomonas sp. SO81]
MGEQLARQIDPLGKPARRGGLATAACVMMQPRHGPQLYL